MSFRHLRLLLACLCLIGLSACGTLSNQTDAMVAPEEKPTANAGASEKDNARDPLEGFNRAMYTFNDKLDRYVLKPLAKGYRAITPAPVSKSISNFFSNLHDPAIMLNNLIQGKPKQAASDLGRVLVNSTIGIAGLFDVASKMGLEKHNEDFGQTLAVWGVGDGPYLVLPFFGPSNVRDGAALPVETIYRRAQLLHASDILDQAAGQDPYVFVREASRQRRRNLIYDGNPPQAAPPPGLFEEDEPAPKSPPQPTPGGATQPR